MHPERGELPVRAPDDALASIEHRVVLIDFEDSFVNTLADYFRQFGARVTTLRHGFDLEILDRLAPDLVVLSPAPGGPRISEPTHSSTSSPSADCLCLRCVLGPAGHDRTRGRNAPVASRALPREANRHHGARKQVT
jgi:hypothetical protein